MGLDATLKYVNIKGADQTMHLCNLISAFVIHFIQHIIEELAILASFCSLAGWTEPYLVMNPEDRFSHIEAHEHMHDKTSKMDCTPKEASDQP